MSGIVSTVLRGATAEIPRLNTPLTNVVPVGSGIHWNWVPVHITKAGDGEGHFVTKLRNERGVWAVAEFPDSKRKKLKMGTTTKLFVLFIKCLKLPMPPLSVTARLAIDKIVDFTGFLKFSFPSLL